MNALRDIAAWIVYTALLAVVVLLLPLVVLACSMDFDEDNRT
jgi:hypothetical protein